jgi:hypothetical protein
MRLSKLGIDIDPRDVSMTAPETAQRFRERRRAVRFPITIPVELEGGTGVTRDVSLSGVFFETNHFFALGEPIRLTLLLERATPGQPVRLQCEGRVVRVERRQPELRLGVAVAIESYRFRKPEQASGPHDVT